MTGTFGSLNIAKTGLQYQQLVMDTASNNISNVNTDGYVRRSVVGGELGATAVSAMWSTSDGHGTGVGVQDVQRLTDQLVDARVRREHGTLSSLLIQQSSLSNVETAINEPSDSGVAAALAGFRSSLQDLSNSPDSAAARSSVLAKAQTLTQALNAQARSVADADGDLRFAAGTDVDQVNADAKQLADLNKAIKTGQASGTDVGTLLDQRDQVALDLANRAGATSTLQPDGSMTVTIGQSVLVQGKDAGSLSLASPDPTAPKLLGFQVTEPGATTATAVTLDSGELSGIAASVATLATYSTKLDGVVDELVNGITDASGTKVTLGINDLQANGYLADGTTGTAAGAFFGTSDGTTTITAANITVALTDPNKIAASGDPSQPLGGSNALAMSTASPKVEDDYQALVTGLGAQVSGLNSSVTTQQAVATQADDAREQQAGVNLDEETISMVAAQHAYEASSRVLTVMDSILDTLINHTGLA